METGRTPAEKKTIEAAPRAAFEHRHRPDLDGVRRILATCVVLLHFGFNSFVTRLTHGQVTGFVFALSVDVFFLLSGFVLTAANARSPRNDLPKFAVKRTLRLVPVFYVTTVLALINSRLDYDCRFAPLELLLGLPFAGTDPTNVPGWSVTWEFYLPIAVYALAPLLSRRLSWQPWLLTTSLIAALAGLAVADIGVAGGGQSYFVRAALSLLGGHLLYALAAGRPRQRQPNIDRAKVDLGWDVTVPLRDGLAETIEYFRGVVGAGI